MYFVVKHTHNYSTCQAHVPESVAAMGDIVTRAPEHNVQVHARYGNRLEHTNFYVIEADSMEDINALFDPVLELGDWDLTPVMKL